MINLLIAADESEADSIAASDDPLQTWGGFNYRGVDSIKLVALWALVDGGSVRDRADDRHNSIRAISGGKNGPWLDIIPHEMVGALGSIADLDDEESPALAEKWSQIEEFDGWEKQEILELLRGTSDLAQWAAFDRKSLMIWTSH